MGGRAVTASCLSLLGYFPLHKVLQEREEGREERDGEGGQLEKRKERKERGGRVIMSDSQSQADSSQVV